MIEVPFALNGMPRFTAPAALTIGVFDGVHQGHRRLLDSVRMDRDLTPVLVTFSRHPADVLAPDEFPGFIMSAAQKTLALEQAGIDVLVCIDFSTDFAKIPGPEFLQVLCDVFDLRHAAIGHDFRCGYQMATDRFAAQSFLSQRGVDVQLASAVEDERGPISSTRIRQAVRAGNLSEAAKLLGRPFALDLDNETLRSGQSATVATLGAGRLLRGSRQIVPPPGQYPATYLSADGGLVGRDGANPPLSVFEESLSLPLAVDSGIRYIVLQDNRVS